MRKREKTHLLINCVNWVNLSVGHSRLVSRACRLDCIPALPLEMCDLRKGFPPAKKKIMILHTSVIICGVQSLLAVEGDAICI